MVEAARACRVERVYMPAYRRTNDSVRSDAKESIILQLPEEINEIESLVIDVLSQGGSVQAIEIGSQHEIQEPKALTRY
jgi:diphthamide synthase subunit DPH2